MERQLANLTGLVQKALTHGPTHLAVPGSQGYRNGKFESESYLYGDRSSVLLSIQKLLRITHLELQWIYGTKYLSIKLYIKQDVD